MINRVMKWWRSVTMTKMDRYMTQEPHRCVKRMWVLRKGESSNSTGEAKYACPKCGDWEFRGGWGSSIWLEKD